MKLHEWQAKEIFKKYGIPVFAGAVVNTPEAAVQAAKELGLPVMVKAQVLTGGRGKAGGVKFCSSLEKVAEHAANILKLSIKDWPVRNVLVTPAAEELIREIYCGIIVDRNTRRAILMASGDGGMDIEELAVTHPEKIVKVPLDPFLGLQPHVARDVAQYIGLPREYWAQFISMTTALARAFIENDASIAEINPLAIIKDGAITRLHAMDGKFAIDDNAMFRHADFEAWRDPDEESGAEKLARQADLNFVSLDGNIGCLVNGAGLAMATLDLIQHFGGKPANFLDVAGGAKAEKVAAALRIILADPKVKVVMFNIFGGITRCDEVARGIVTAIAEVKPKVPFVVRLSGTNKEAGDAILATAGVISASNAAEAAQKAVALAK